MIRRWCSPKQLKTFGVGENYFARGGFSSASGRRFSERGRIAGKFNRRRRKLLCEGRFLLRLWAPLLRAESDCRQIQTASGS